MLMQPLLSERVIGPAINVRALGPGLLEPVYETCLAFELRTSLFRRQVPIPVTTACFRHMRRSH
jgi:hypothetical protein